MSLIRLAYANLKEHLLTTGLSIMLLAIGVGMVSFIITVSEQLNDRFNRDVRGIDMVVGAKGSPLQLILSAVYQIDNPTGNISVSESRKISDHPLVKYSIPLSYGDSYRGFRIVGTDTMYLNHFNASFSDGGPWKKTMDVVLGASAARQLNMGLGAHFHGTHGFEEEGHAHDEVHYNVVGVLKETGSVVDRLILTSTESVWDIHSHESHSDEENAEEDLQYTALLVKFKSPMGLMQLPRFINEKTSMQAALPAIEINRLYDLMGVGFSTLQAIGVLMMIIAAMSVFISLLNSLKERKQELALMRVLGASPSKLFGLVILESLLLCLVGYVIGIILGRVSLMVLSGLGEQEFKFGIELGGVATVEIWLLPFTLSIGLVAAIIPAIRAYGSNISNTLKDG